MKNNAHLAFRHTAMAAALLGAFGQAVASDEEVAALTQPESTISVGVGNWSSDRPQQGIYDGMRDNGAYGLVDVDIVRRDNATGAWFTATGRNLGLDNRDLNIDYLRQGDIGVGVFYDRTPRDNPLQFNSGITGKSSERQNLVTVQPGRGNDIELGTKRDATGLRFYKNLLPGLEFNASFKNEEKDGTRHWGRGGAAEFAVEPIDSTTRQFEARLDYAVDKLQLSGGYYGSWYENHNSLVHTTANNANPFYLSLPLDNQAHQLYLEGGYNFTPTTRGTFKLSYAHATQDESLPTRTVAAIPNFSGAPYSLDGEVNTTLVQLGLTSRPIKDLSLVANLRYHDVDDQTPDRRVVQPVTVTPTTCKTPASADACVDITPFSYRTVSGKLEGTYRLAHGYSVTAGVDHRDQDRNVPKGVFNAAGLDVQRVVPLRSDIEETTYRIEGRKSMSDTVNGSISYQHSDRDGSSYARAAGGPGGAPSDLINPIHLADRTRDKWRLGLDWTPLENLTTQFVYENARDDYDTKSNRPYGLIDGEAEIYTLDATYALTDEWSVSAWYSHDDTQAKQYNGDGATGTVVPIKTSDLREKGNSVGLGIRGKAFARLSLGADVQWAETNSEYPQAVQTSATARRMNNLPDIENKLTRVSLFAKYALDKQSDIRLDFIHERWKTDDWSWQYTSGTPFSYGTTTDGTTVTLDKKQTSNFVGARYIYRFQ